MIAKESEVAGCKRYSPRCIKPRSLLQPLQQLAIGREFVHKSETREVEVIVHAAVLLGIGHVQTAVDFLHVEGSKVAWNFVVSEGIGIMRRDQLKIRVVNLYPTRAEVGDVKEESIAILGDCRPFVYSTLSCARVRGIVYYLNRIACPRPGRNGAVFCYEAEDRGRFCPIVVKLKA